MTARSAEGEIATTPGSSVRSRLVASLAMVAFAGVLKRTYAEFIAPTFGYLGFTYREPDPVRYFVMVGLVAALAWIMPRRLSRPSDFVLWVHFVIATAPSMLVPLLCPILHTGTAFRFGLGVAVVWAIAILLASDRVRPTVTLRARPAKVSLWLPVLLAASLLVDGLIVLLGGLRLELLSLFSVAEVRLTYRVALAAAPFGTAYVLLGVMNVVNPLLMMIGLRAGKVALFGFGAFGQFVIYGFTGYKMVALSIPVIVGLHLWMRRRLAVESRMVAVGTTGLMAVAYVAWTIFANSSLATLFVLRLVVAPGNLAAGYVSIFRDREPVYWSYSFMGWLIDYPYPTSPNFLVGHIFRGSDVTSANVNMFGDGFMNMRWEGVVLEILLFVVALWAFDAAGRGIPIDLAASATLLPAFALANSSIFTALTTHGLLLAMVVLLTMPRDAGWSARTVSRKTRERRA